MPTKASARPRLISPFKVCLYRIATNNARQFHRRRRLISFILFFDLERSDPEDPNVSLDRLDIRFDVEQALLEVPWEQRELIVLHHVEGLKYREIAEVVGITEEAVRKRVARGSQPFRQTFESQRA